MDTFDAGHIIALEREALDRWGAGDPQGYLEIMASTVTYFDPSQPRRIDGHDGLSALLVPLTGRIKVDRYDMQHPVVQRHGDAAILTFNLVSYQERSDDTEVAVARWNATEAYAQIDGRWRLVHSHWSFVQPDLKERVSEEA